MNLEQQVCSLDPARNCVSRVDRVLVADAGVGVPETESGRAVPKKKSSLEFPDWMYCVASHEKFEKRRKHGEGSKKDQCKAEGE